MTGVNGPDGVLADIVAGVREDLAVREQTVSLDTLKERALRMQPALDPLPLLRSPGVSVIAEVKRASPSQGTLAPIDDPAELARSYAAGGAAAISVLTESRRFGGSLGDLAAVRAAVEVPVLRKDFVVSSYQLWEARAVGADMVLLMASVLDQQALECLIDRARSIGLTPLVEAHTDIEVERSLVAGAQLLGINNRDLTTLRVDLATFGRLAPLVPPAVARVAESGIRGPHDVFELAQAGADAVLVGTSLVSGSAAGTDPAAAVADLVAAGAHPALQQRTSR
ncbi:MAG: indole-3-glycerol phosphate synthase TrpC [Jiangellales bacterium]